MENIAVRQRLFFFIVFAILIVLMALMLKPFFTVLIVSLISVIMLKPVYNYFLGREWIRGRKGLASSLTLLALLLLLVVPVLLITWLVLSQMLIKLTPFSASSRTQSSMLLLFMLGAGLLPFCQTHGQVAFHPKGTKSAPVFE